MKPKYILLFLSCLIISQQYGQTFDEYKKKQDTEFSTFKQKQQEFISQMQNEFDEYVKQQDREYTKYLEEEWKTFKVFKGEYPPNIPKPPDTPKYEDNDTARESAIIEHIRRPSKLKDGDKTPPIIHPRIKKTSLPESKGTLVHISFYGNPVSFNIDEEVIIPAPESISTAVISEYWKSFSNSNYGPLIDQLQNYKDILNLNDWAYYLLAQTIAGKLYPDSENGAELWSLLTRSGYKARVGYTNNQVSLLIPTNNTLYSRLFIESEGLTFYMMKELETDNIRTYDRDHPDAQLVLDFNIVEPLNFTQDLNQRKFNFQYRNKPYSFAINYNKNVIDFYSNYPQVNLEVYFNAAVSNASRESILEGISNIISEMREEQAVSFLLDFVQTAFTYETDNKQFGKEKFFFTEETIFYPASDCEDRSVLFAYLVRELLDLKVIGLSYPGHVSTAVKLSKKTEGDRIIFEKDEYIVADATYENAPLGLAMSDFKNKTPELIILNNSTYYESLNQSYWNLANHSGGYRGDQLNDLISDKNGSVYLTGYFMGNAEFDDYLLDAKSEQTGRSAFVAKYNKYKQVEWAKQINSSQNATAYALKMDGDGNLFVAGSFDGTLEYAGQNDELICKENSTDAFLAKLSEHGQLLWIKKAGLDTYPQGNYFSFNVKFTKDGDGKGTTLYSENEYQQNYGLSVDHDGLLNIDGSFMSSTGFGMDMISMKADAGSEFEVYKSLKLENDKLIENEYEQTIAGVFSVLNHVRLKGFKMLGADAQKTLDEYNPDFQDKYPDIYEGISKINFVMNEDGILSLETLNEKTVILRELKLKNNAKMKVTHFEDGNAIVNVLSGVQVGKFFIWFDLNYAKMFKKDGNILFDYDSNHAQKLMNLKEDILD